MGSLHQQLHILSDLAAQKSGIGVAMNSAEKGRDVNIADIPILQDGGIRNTVANYFVQGRT
jgi:hypothetical protein